jgi:hypothetical protein
MVSVAPDEVVMVSVTGLGMWRVADDPPEVLTVTDETEIGRVSVTVPPEAVRTCETTGS